MLGKHRSTTTKTSIYKEGWQEATMPPHHPHKSQPCRRSWLGSLSSWGLGWHSSRLRATDVSRRSVGVVQVEEELAMQQADPLQGDLLSLQGKGSW